MNVDTAMEAAVEFLLAARVREGWWEDFDTTFGLSDEWVTAYVGAALAAIPGTRSAQGAREAWALVSRRRWWSGGWGFNATVPADADSTQCALRLAAAIGAHRSIRVRRGRRFLADHMKRSGGIAAYAAVGPALFYLGLQNLRNIRRRQPLISFRGWSAAHVCVTAAAATVPELNTRQPVRAYLRRTQAPDGGWSAYWWSDREYATAYAAEALAMNAEPEDLPRLRLALEWAGRRLDPDGAVRSALLPDGSPFATAWCLRLLALAADEPGGRERLERGLTWLLQHQRVDGSWSPSAPLQIPPIDLVNPEQHEEWIFNGQGGGTIRFDQEPGVFTTATVVEALQIASARLAEARTAGCGAS